MILGNGQFVPRGTVLEEDKLPPKFRTEEHVVMGRVTINNVMPIDMIEVGNDVEEISTDEQFSPMRELTVDQLQQSVREKPKKIIRRRLS